MKEFTAKGTFWLPEFPEDTVRGELSFSHDKGLLLVTYDQSIVSGLDKIFGQDPDNYTTLDGRKDSSDNSPRIILSSARKFFYEKPFVIYGQLDNNLKLLSLLKCSIVWDIKTLPLSFNLQPVFNIELGILSSEQYFNSLDDVKVQQLTLITHDLGNWFLGFKDLQSANRNNYKITIEPVEKTLIEAKEYTITLCSDESDRSYFNQRLTVQFDSNIEIEFLEITSLETALKLLVNKVRTFLILLSEWNININFIRGEYDNDELEILIHSDHRLTQSNKDSLTLFNLAETIIIFQNNFPKWLLFYESNNFIVEDYMYLIKSKQETTYMFFELVRVLEGYLNNPNNISPTQFIKPYSDEYKKITQMIQQFLSVDENLDSSTVNQINNKLQNPKPFKLKEKISYLIKDHLVEYEVVVSRLIPDVTAFLKSFNFYRNTYAHGNQALHNGSIDQMYYLSAKLYWLIRIAIFRSIDLDPELVVTALSRQRNYEYACALKIENPPNQQDNT